MATQVTNIITIGEDTADVILLLVGIAFPPALPFIAIAKVVIPLMGAVAPYVIEAVKNGTSPFAAADAAKPGLGVQIAAIAERIPVDASLNLAINHLDNVTLMLVAKSTKGFAVPGWSDAETQKWIDNATPATDSDSRAGSG